MILKKTFFLHLLGLALSGWVLLFSHKALALAQRIYRESKKQISPCPQTLLIYSNANIAFTKTERRFICGDKKIAEWSKLPANQVRTHLKAILQSKGFYDVRFSKRGKKVVAQLEEAIKVEQVKVKGLLAHDLVDAYNEAQGKTLTPDLLNSVREWFKSRLSMMGYPCAEVRVSAQPKDRQITVHVDDAEMMDLVEVQAASTKEVNPEIFSRYYAFDLGKRFNSNLLELTSRRMVSSGILQHNRYSISCTQEGAVARQVSVFGNPRIFTLGIGADTEVGPVGKISWTNPRLGDRGHTFRASLYASYREQSLQLSGEFYPTPTYPRFYLGPVIEGEHQREKDLETLGMKTSFMTATSWDGQTLGLRGSVGPSVNYEKTIDGLGPRGTTFFTLRSYWQLMSHRFEYYRASPRDGYMLELNTEHTRENIFSPVSANLLALDFQWLSNIGRKDPPLLILGLRGRSAFTFFSDGPENITNLPSAFRHFLGGTRDLRGFSRREIPEDAKGALASLYMGVEARSKAPLMESLQSMVFTDVGLIGKSPMNLNAPLYWSPGIGLRYSSPIGTFRATAAHGFLAFSRESGQRERLSHYQFYLSYGEEF